MRASENPFRSEIVTALAFQGEPPGALADRFARQRPGSEIVGPAGSGKTACLTELARELGARGVVFERYQLTESELGRVSESPKVPWRARRDSIVLIDDAHLFSGPKLTWVLNTRRCVVTTRRTLGLPLLHECRTSPELLADLVARAAELDGRSGLALSARDAEALWREHGGNLRDAFRALYDRFAASGGKLG